MYCVYESCCTLSDAQEELFRTQISHIRPMFEKIKINKTHFLISKKDSDKKRKRRQRRQERSCDHQDRNSNSRVKPIKLTSGSKVKRRAWFNTYCIIRRQTINILQVSNILNILHLLYLCTLHVYCSTCSIIIS